MTDDARSRRTPGIPGTFADMQWVDSPDFGDAPEDRRIKRVYDVDPAPLARVIATYLGLINDDLSGAMRDLANDDKDGPIHLVHLLGACEHAARGTGGGMPGSDGPRGDGAARLISASVSGDALPALVDALRAGGYPAATQLARSMDADTRRRVLDSLLQYWGAPIFGLCIDLTDDNLKRTRS
jgi:hypothetical protein